MKILVTGARGFIGSHICRALQAHGCEVRALRSVLPPKGGNHEDLWRVEWMDADLLTVTDRALAEMCRGVDACIHAAWFVVPGEYLTSPKNDEYRAASIRLFSSLLEGGCRTITGVGTCFEYEQTDHPLDESARLNPVTPYAAAKLATFVAGEALARQAGASFAWARLFYLYGPREDPRRLVASVARQLLKGERAAVTSGRQVRDFLHVSDVAKALMAVTEARLHGPVNVGSGEPVQVRAVVETIGDITGRADLIDFGARPDNAVDPPYVCADNDRLKNETGWMPRYDLREGLEQTVGWWRNRTCV
jgi:nucleoside-diphosphate-sugar epimerase